MKLILNGGGCAEKTKDIYAILDSLIDNSKPILCIVLAREKDETGYESSRKWMINELANIRYNGLVIPNSSTDLATLNLSDFAMVYISGGNTYKLLKELKETNAFENIKKYIETDGIVYGSSAGMIIFGKTINSSSDTNSLNLLDINGYNFGYGVSFAAHYTNKNEEKTNIATDFLTELSFEEPIIALPEENSLYIDSQIFKVIGTKPWYLFKNGIRQEVLPGIEYAKNEFNILVGI